MTETSKKPVSLKKKLVIISLSFLILITIVGVVLLKLLNKPTSAVVTYSEKSISSPLIYNIDLTPILQNSQYASFDRPKALKLVSSSLNDSATSLESYTYYVKDVYSWILAVDVTTSSDGFNGLSSYLIRVGDPSVYKASSQVVNNRPITVFTDSSFTNGFSKVAFFNNGNEIATVSLVGNDSSGTGPLSKTFNMVLNSWHWF